MTETVLFMGGSMDGKTLVVREGIDRIHIPAMDGEGVNEIYCRVVPHTPIHDRPFPADLISTESPDNLIPLLIEGYRRKECK